MRLTPSVTAGTVVPWSPTSPDSLVGDGGNPAEWPAAQAKAPSLAGAYSSNMMKVVVTLIAYQDWVYSHPDPALVQNYYLPGGNVFAGEVHLLGQLQRNGWRADPSPTEIDWMKVANQPKPLLLVNGRVGHIDNRRAYTPASVEIVLDQHVGDLLSETERIVGHTPGGGKKAFSVILSQGSDARWRIIDINPLHLTGGLRELTT